MNITILDNILGLADPVELAMQEEKISKIKAIQNITQFAAQRTVNWVIYIIVQY